MEPGCCSEIKHEISLSQIQTLQVLVQWTLQISVPHIMMGLSTTVPEANCDSAATRVCECVRTPVPHYGPRTLTSTALKRSSSSSSGGMGDLGGADCFCGTAWGKLALMLLGSVPRGTSMLPAAFPMTATTHAATTLTAEWAPNTHGRSSETRVLDSRRQDPGRRMTTAQW